MENIKVVENVEELSNVIDNYDEIVSYKIKGLQSNNLSFCNQLNDIVNKMFWLKVNYFYWLLQEEWIYFSISSYKDTFHIVVSFLLMVQHAENSYAWIYSSAHWLNGNFYKESCINTLEFHTTSNRRPILWIVF